MPKPKRDLRLIAQEERRRAVQEKLSGRTYSASVEVKNPWVYYDTWVVAAGTTKTTLFNNASAKNYSLTNYPYQNLPSGQAYDIYGLRVSYFAITALSDVNHLALFTFLNNCVLDLQISNKVPSFERPLAALIGGQVQVVTAPAVTVNSRNLSVWEGNTIVRFKRKISIDEDTRWTANISKDAAPGAGLVGDFLRVETIGELTAQL